MESHSKFHGSSHHQPDLLVHDIAQLSLKNSCPSIRILISLQHPTGHPTIGYSSQLPSRTWQRKPRFPMGRSCQNIQNGYIYIYRWGLSIARSVLLRGSGLGSHGPTHHGCKPLAAISSRINDPRLLRGVSNGVNQKISKK